MKSFILGAGICLLCVLLAFRACAANEERDAAAIDPPEMAVAAEHPEPTPEPVIEITPEPVPEAVIEPEPVPTETAPPQHYTEADAIALAQMAWGECRGVGSLMTYGKEISGTYQKAATMWVACNRYDAGFGGSIYAVVSAPYQFLGYAASNPVDPGLLALAYDVLERWNMERNGGTDVGRVLPADCHWFYGDGKHNYFRDAYIGGREYMWELPDVYAGAGE